MAQNVSPQEVDAASNALIVSIANATDHLPGSFAIAVLQHVITGINVLIQEYSSKPTTI